MNCDNCPFLDDCVVGSEHVFIEASKCPLYRAIEANFEKYNEE